MKILFYLLIALTGVSGFLFPSIESLILQIVVHLGLCVALYKMNYTVEGIRVLVLLICFSVIFGYLIKQDYLQKISFITGIMNAVFGTLLLIIYATPKLIKEYMQKREHIDFSPIDI
ncbi:MAG: hypothetical protein IPO86_05465 [Saprospiraceae bacterium]|nr:hypothetical protein [Saprospiraceae bacterium]